MIDLAFHFLPVRIVCRRLVKLYISARFKLSLETSITLKPCAIPSKRKSSSKSFASSVVHTSRLSGDVGLVSGGQKVGAYMFPAGKGGVCLVCEWGFPHPFTMQI